MPKRNCITHFLASAEQAGSAAHVTRTNSIDGGRQAEKSIVVSTASQTILKESDPLGPPGLHQVVCVCCTSTYKQFTRASVEAFPLSIRSCIPLC